MKQFVAVFVAIVLLFSLPSFVLPVFAKEEVTSSEKIVIVGDISGSLGEDDVETYVKNGLKLSVDLAPNASELS